MSRFFCGRQPRHLIAPSSSGRMPLLTVEVADNRTFCPAVAKRCDYPQVAGAGSCFWPCFPAKRRRIASYVRFAVWFVRRIACFVPNWPKRAILRTRSPPSGLRARNRADRLLCAIVPLLCRCWCNRRARRTMDVFKPRLHCRLFCHEGGCYGCKGVRADQ